MQIFLCTESTKYSGLAGVINDVIDVAEVFQWAAVFKQLYTKYNTRTVHGCNAVLSKFKNFCISSATKNQGAKSTTSQKLPGVRLLGILSLSGNVAIPLLLM